MVVEGIKNNNRLCLCDCEHHQPSHRYQQCALAHTTETEEHCTHKIVGTNECRACALCTVHRQT